MPRHFVIVTSDGAGLGWAKKLSDEGESVTLALEPTDDEEAHEEFSQLGDGIVTTTTLTEAQKSAPKESYWIFDTNAHSDVAMKLRKQGSKVFGAHEDAEQLEHDRGHAIAVAQSVGLDCPEMYECSTVAEGLDYLRENHDTAYVFKPNDADCSYLTFVPFRDRPKDANEELQGYLEHLTDGVKNGFVLQERKSGVEVTFCLWLSNGSPVLGECTLESKRQLNGDVGEIGPCSQDVIFTVPMDCIGIRETATKLAKSMPNWTGLLDVNCIVADNKAWFLETGCRFGYNAHPNLFTTLSVDPIGSVLADLIDGNTGGFDKRFRSGFGASVSLRLDHPRKLLPIHLDDHYQQFFYPYDLARSGDQWLLTGYSPDVGVYARHGYTIREAGERALNDLAISEAVSFPDMGFRTDVARDDYEGAPIRRYQALEAMGWLK